MKTYYFVMTLFFITVNCFCQDLPKISDARFNWGLDSAYEKFSKDLGTYINSGPNELENPIYKLTKFLDIIDFLEREHTEFKNNGYKDKYSKKNKHNLLMEILLSQYKCLLIGLRMEYKFQHEDYYGSIADFNLISCHTDESYPKYIFKAGLAYILLKKVEKGCLLLSRAGELGYKKAYEYIKEACH